MANPKRLAILNLLVEDEVSVGVMADQMGISQSALSQHLALLRSQKLVSFRRDAQTIYYSSSSEAVESILTALKEIAGKRQELSVDASAGD